MKKHYLLGLALCWLAALPAAAQVKVEGAPSLLLKAPMGLMCPVWSPDGSKIAVTTDRYEGIMVAGRDGSALHSVCTAEKAGYKMAWDAASTRVIPNALAANAQATVSAGLFRDMLTDPAGVAAATPALAQFAGKTVINPALSPDGSRIAFQVVGRGLWVINADGSALQSLGAGSHPSWMPDSRNIVYTIVEDDGANFTASCLMSADAVTGRTAVTFRDSDYVPMTPAVSPDGSVVAFENASDAAIYTLNIKK